MSNKLKKVFIWASAYVSFLCLALVGGYTLLKSDQADLKKTAKTAIIVSLIFLAVEAFFLLFGYFGGMSTNYFASSFYDFVNISTKLVSIAKIGVYTFFIIKESCVKDVKTNETKTKEEKDEIIIEK